MFGQDDSSGGVSSSAFSGDRLSINWFDAASVGGIQLAKGKAVAIFTKPV
ncbi:hypothetical protein GCM10029976_003060 [Kribbella albertanoniae]